MANNTAKKREQEQREARELKEQEARDAEVNERVQELINELPSVECSIETPTGTQLVIGSLKNIIEHLARSEDNAFIRFDSFTWMNGDEMKRFDRYVRRETIMGVIEWTPEMWETHLRNQVTNGSQEPVRASAG